MTTSERRKEKERARERERGRRRSGEREEGKREREKETRYGEKNERHARRKKEGRYVEVARLRGRSVSERNGDTTRNEERGIGSYRKVERGDNETTREGWRQREAERVRRLSSRVFGAAVGFRGQAVPSVAQSRRQLPARGTPFSLNHTLNSARFSARFLRRRRRRG